MQNPNERRRRRERVRESYLGAELIWHQCLTLIMHSTFGCSCHATLQKYVELARAGGYSHDRPDILLLHLSRQYRIARELKHLDAPGVDSASQYMHIVDTTQLLGPYSVKSHSLSMKSAATHRSASVTSQKGNSPFSCAFTVTFHSLITAFVAAGEV